MQQSSCLGCVVSACMDALPCLLRCHAAGLIWLASVCCLCWRRLSASRRSIDVSCPAQVAATRLACPGLAACLLAMAGNAVAGWGAQGGAPASKDPSQVGMPQRETAEAVAQLALHAGRLHNLSFQV